ncbi:hypothetical protein HYFRA_00013190 [Hymenoscyphus fraxineus]|uniref:FMN hydroxy acid dehydrogenase domain-containing protein n=1 Tax=Hymenoscyphus fraxineus TaxID=746836 RepID=A0A9N9L9I1_9HELO|nr:hypothetical protein HYFRA_00013190 [Hymenoscyphus fraxineus]
MSSNEALPKLSLTQEKKNKHDYGAHQSNIYRAIHSMILYRQLRSATDGTFLNKFPLVTTDPNKLAAQAKEKLPETSYNYIAGGAGEKATMDANRLAFRQWKLVPRMLRETSIRDLTIELFGEKYETPILMAPIGVQSIFHEDKETGLAEICADLDVPFIMSTAASSTIEEVAAASGNGPRWYQLYWPQDDEVTLSLLDRAKKNGFRVLVVTLDTWALAWRPADLDHGYVPFIKGTGVQVGLSDPVFRRKCRERFGHEPEENIVEASVAWLGDVVSGKSHTWDRLKLLRDNWEGPLVLKGIQKHPEDAKLAIEHGCDGIIVSNHGGRQLDGAVASLEMLPEIVDAVGDKATVLFDSGIRTAVDIIKALSLGAKAVLVGRPVIYGLGIAGKAGAKEVLQGILADLDQSMGLAGIQRVEDCKREMLRKVVYGGDVKSSY